MDARITKQRLGNMLSYDWLKILCSIAAAVTALVLFFTMVGTRPTRAQRFYVHAYGGLTVGTDFSRLSETLPDELSYDILDVNSESFGTGYLDDAAYTARRSALEGNVVFAADYTASEAEDALTPFALLVQMGIGGRGELGMFEELDTYFSDCEGYLARFFGENWQNAPVADEAEIEACFRARNVDGSNNGHRYKTDAQIAAGIADERERLETLRKDYLFVQTEGFAKNLLSFKEYVAQFDTYDEEGNVVQGSEKTFVAGINVGRLTNLERLVSYSDAEGKSAHAAITCLIYKNGDSVTDLRFEAVSFLAYLLRHYA